MRCTLEKKADISTKPITGLIFAVAAAVLLFSILILYLIGLVALENNRQLARKREVITQLERVVSTIIDAETGQRGFLLTGEARYLKPYDQALADIEVEVRELQRLGARGDLAPERVEVIRRLAVAKLQELQATIDLAKTNGMQAAVEIVRSHRGQSLMEALRAHLTDLERTQVADFEAAYARTQKATVSRNVGFLLTAFLNLAFLGWAYRRIRREILARENAREELRRSHAELEKKVEARTRELTTTNKEMEAFGYTVSHDLRAPLRHIQSYATFLQEDVGEKLDEEHRAYLGSIMGAARRMSELLNDLLTLSRVGRAAMVEQPVRLVDLVNEVRQELVSTNGERQIEWRIGYLPEVYGDPTLLRSAISNLLSNAVKYSRVREIAIIEVQSEWRNRELVFWIKDNGAGFDMKYKDKLFGVFQRLHTTGEFEGTGIGLASVRRVIQRHGGRTWAEGAPGKGATFYFSLPSDRILEGKPGAGRVERQAA